MTPKGLQQAILHFSNEQVCVDFIAKMRWPDGVSCPRCDSERVSWVASRKVWQCKDCRKQSSVKVGTTFEDSPIPLSKWLPAIWLITSANNGISSYELHRALDVTQKTAWFMLHRIRLAMETDTSFKFPGKVEIDVQPTYGYCLATLTRNKCGGAKERINDGRTNPRAITDSQYRVRISGT